MKWRESMSKEFDQIADDLKNINKLMIKVNKNWENISDEKEFYKLSKMYPKYLPSFDDFQFDFKEWVNSL
jgi:hypothetical protein